MTDGFYRAFEEKLRGSRELIKSRLRVYLPFVEPLRDLYEDCIGVDLGCGRGEWLELMEEVGISARGVDLDEGMLAACVERQLTVERSDAVTYLRALPMSSIAVVSGFHVAEHIPFADLQALVQESLRVLKPAGLLILETPNPENLTVGAANFYCDPTHERPIPPPLLSFLPGHYGFARTKVMRLQEPTGLIGAVKIGLSDVLSGVSPDYAVVAQKRTDTIEQSTLFDVPFKKEYGLTLDALGARFQARIEQLSQTQEQLSQAQKQLDATYNSTSWKLTAPVRSAGIAAHKLREKAARIKLSLKIWLKQQLVKASAYFAARPALKSKVLLVLQSFPRLHARIASAARPHSQTSDSRDPVWSTIHGPEDLTESGRRVFQDLLDARAAASAKGSEETQAERTH